LALGIGLASASFAERDIMRIMRRLGIALFSSKFAQ
jgi:hypothetical protein